MTETNALHGLLDGTQGVIGAVIATTRGEPSAVSGDASQAMMNAANAAAITGELEAIGQLLGLGGFGLASLKGARASHLLARQAGAVLAIELDPKSPIGELEAKVRLAAWVPDARPAAPIERAVASAPTARPPGTPPPPPRRANRGTRHTFARDEGVADLPPFQDAVPLKPAVAVAAVGSGAVFAGDLNEFAIPDLLEFLRNSQRTGVLVCTTSIGIGTVRLARGLVIDADSPNALDLRHHLLDAPELSPERRQLLAALPDESLSDSALADGRGIRGLVSGDEIERARVARIYSAFREMLRWTTGRFAFDPGSVTTINSSPALSPQAILMQLCQEQDEQTA